MKFLDAIARVLPVFVLVPEVVDDDDCHRACLKVGNICFDIDVSR